MPAWDRARAWLAGRRQLDSGGAPSEGRPLPPPARDVARGIRCLAAEEIDWFHSVDLGGGRFTAGTKSPSDLELEFSRLGLSAETLRGKTLLDVGCADGWNSLRCRTLGADVTAVDGVYRDGLRYVRTNLRPEFHFVQVDVLSPSFLELGCFDVVLYLGVLYHTLYPYEQLSRVAKLCRGTLFVESAVLNLPHQAARATLTFNLDGSVVSDLSSPVFPSTVWITQALGRLGFRSVDVLHGGRGELDRVLIRAADLRSDQLPVVFAAEQSAA
jgi:tRNA (mo5U34)-methyltransferase